MSSKWIRRIALSLDGLVGLLAVVFVVLYSIGTARANQTYDIPVTVPPIPSDAAAIARGEHLATTFSLCKRCHGEDLSGKLEFDVPGLVTIPAPNLTAGAGGVGTFYTDEDWVRAIRHGVGHDGHGLMIMTAKAFTHLSDADVGALIAYVKLWRIHRPGLHRMPRGAPQWDTLRPTRRRSPLAQFKPRRRTGKLDGGRFYQHLA